MPVTMCIKFRGLGGFLWGLGEGRTENGWVLWMDVDGKT